MMTDRLATWACDVVVLWTCRAQVDLPLPGWPFMRIMPGAMFNHTMQVINQVNRVHEGLSIELSHLGVKLMPEFKLMPSG